MPNLVSVIKLYFSTQIENNLKKTNHDIQTTASRNQGGSRLNKIRNWLAGILIFSGLLVAVSHFSEIEHFVQLLRQAEPLWLVLAISFQACTYCSVAGVWYLALRFAGVHFSYLALVPLGIAKLFSDQAMPSGGMSGTAFFVTALNRKGVETQFCMATMLVSLIGYYLAYLVAAVASVMLLWVYHRINVWVISITVIFCLVAVAIPSAAFILHRVGRKDSPIWLLKIPGVQNLLQAFRETPLELVRNPFLMIAIILLHEAIFVLDGATLWVMLMAVGQQVSFWTAFPCFILASIVATLGPIPLGLGTFEATCVSMLGVLSVPLEAALTATLLLRGFTLWLPMVPGLWLAKRGLD